MNFLYLCKDYTFPKNNFVEDWYWYLDTNLLKKPLSIFKAHPNKEIDAWGILQTIFSSLKKDVVGAGAQFSL